jgi:hypothetical protein
MTDINTVQSDLDTLMDRILEDPTIATPQDIDKIIALHRNYRARIEGGEKPKRESKGVKLDLEQLGLKTPSEPIKRRI